MDRVDGNDREDTAAAAAATIAAIWAGAELAVLSALAMSVRAALPLASATVSGVRRLQRQAAAVLAEAERRTRQVIVKAGIPWDYTPILPAAQPPPAPPPPVPAPPPPPAAGPAASVPELPPAGPPPAAIPASLEPEATAAAARAAQVPTGPSIRDMIEQVTARVYREIPDIYQEAVRQAIEETRGGLPGNSLSLSRIQAAQKALDQLAGHGITGFTDRAGRNWDLLGYVEMATRTAVSNAWDNLQNAAIIRGGHDLIWTLTTSTEGSCPLCLPWLGRVLSLTGQTAGLAQIADATGQLVTANVAGTLTEARAAGFRHPNCRCSWVPFTDGADLAQAAMFAEPADTAAATYEASQRQRAYERAIRQAGREEHTALTPQARNRARRHGEQLRRAAAEHRAQTGLRMTQAGVRRREHPHHAH